MSVWAAFLTAEQAGGAPALDRANERVEEEGTGAMEVLEEGDLDHRIWSLKSCSGDELRAMLWAASWETGNMSWRALAGRDSGA